MTPSARDAAADDSTPAGYQPGDEPASDRPGTGSWPSDELASDQMGTDQLSTDAPASDELAGRACGTGDGQCRAGAGPAAPGGPLGSCSG